MPTNFVIENDPQSNTGSAIIVNVGETTSTTMTTTNESANMGTTDQGNEPRRGDILPIIYDVQSIPTISSGGSTQMNRGGPGRQQQRPSMSSMFPRKEIFDTFLRYKFSSSFSNTSNVASKGSWSRSRRFRWTWCRWWCWSRTSSSSMNIEHICLSLSFSLSLSIIV